MLPELVNSYLVNDRFSLLINLDEERRNGEAKKMATFVALGGIATAS